MKEIVINVLKSIWAFISRRVTIQTDAFTVSLNEGKIEFDVSQDFEEMIKGLLKVNEDGKIVIPTNASKDGIGETDEKFGAVDVIEKKLLPPLYKFHQSRISFNQLDTGKMDCTWTASLTAYANLLNKPITLNVRKELKKQALAGGLSESEGRYLWMVVALIVNYFGDVRSYQEDTGSEAFYAVLRKGYMVITGFRGNRVYNNDAQDDGEVTLEDINNPTYGHAVCLTYIPTIDSICVVDNYKGVNKYNVYKLRTFKELVDNGVFFKNSFYLVQK